MDIAPVSVITKTVLSYLSLIQTWFSFYISLFWFIFPVHFLSALFVSFTLLFFNFYGGVLWFWWPNFIKCYCWFLRVNHPSFLKCLNVFLLVILLLCKLFILSLNHYKLLLELHGLTISFCLQTLLSQFQYKLKNNNTIC